MKRFNELHHLLFLSLAFICSNIFGAAAKSQKKDFFCVLNSYPYQSQSLVDYYQGERDERILRRLEQASIDPLIEQLLRFCSKNRKNIDFNATLVIKEQNEPKFECDPLRIAIMLGDMGLINFLISSGAHVHRLLNNESNILVALKSRRNIEKIVSNLISRNISFNMHNKELEFALSKYATTGDKQHLGCLMLLLRNGADIDKKNTFGKTFIEFANEYTSANDEEIANIRKILANEVNRRSQWSDAVLPMLKETLPFSEPLCKLIEKYSWRF